MVNTEKLNANPVHKEELEIAVAFKELVDSLPDNLKDLNAWFDSTEKVIKEIEKELRATYQHMNKLSEPYAEMLLPHGITALTVFIAAESVESLLYNIMRNGKSIDFIEVDKEKLILVGDVVDDDVNARSVQGYAIQEIIELSGKIIIITNRLNRWVVPYLYSPAPIEGFLASIWGTLTGLGRYRLILPEETASKLLSWLIAVAQYRPFLFNGFEMKTADSRTTFVLCESYKKRLFGKLIET